jgi:hypothetical protein
MESVCSGLDEWNGIESYLTCSARFVAKRGCTGTKQRIDALVKADRLPELKQVAAVLRLQDALRMLACYAQRALEQLRPRFRWSGQEVR